MRLCQIDNAMENIIADYYFHYSYKTKLNMALEETSEYSNKHKFVIIFALNNRSTRYRTEHLTDIRQYFKTPHSTWQHQNKLTQPKT